MSYKKSDCPRVLLLAQYDHAGGTRTYAKQLVKFYEQNNFNLTVVAQGPVDDDDMSEYCRSHRVRFLHISEVAVGRVGPGRMPWRLYRERRTLNTFIAESSPDIIVASVGTPGLFLGHLGNGRRSIYVLHTSPEHARSKLKRLVNRLIWKVSIPRGICFITVSQYARSRMLDVWGLDCRKEKVAVIYSSVGSVVVPPEVSQESVQVLTVGHVVDYKNPMFWIEAAAEVVRNLPMMRFLWVGPGPLIDLCRQRVTYLGLQKNIQFVGTSENVSKYYEKCDIYVQPSKVENLSLSVLDAMRYGKPCVVTNVGGFPELVHSGETGWMVDVDDQHELAQRVIQLANDPNERKRMGNSAQAVYASHFYPERWEDEMRKLHDKVLFS
ncbi:Glycosyltransferase involved in cell wall bisynthesis [Desulfomicrobium norvegicum]|uniref:Glycosyltransferase involved in cell wall bisynthesis n=1 Tax=Desulfomicrobium norvegicum (strain DSM 1741 / NCIMB 8310) TaxID=52561 RepID=A0A8G2F582_DESNO|nr:glycosyltransferase [Desulfomicrobium norvegicum]SFL47040.1 Glycosyltransferase involved in cell wall bisynthesis [Desulfomicrobium norvegicum]